MGVEMARKVIITCAVTGSIYTPTMSPHLPVTGPEIAAASIDAANAGAAIIHLHARHPDDGRPSADPDHFKAFTSKIDTSCSAVLNISTGGSSLMSLDDRLAPAREISPEMCSLNMGSMNFGLFPMLKKHNQLKFPWEKDMLERSKSSLFKNTFEDIENIMMLGYENGTRFEFECYDVGHLYNLHYFHREGMLKGPYFIQFVMGIMGGIGADADNLLHLKKTADRLLGDNYQFSVLAAGRHQIPLATMGVVLGGNVRVGLEDSLTIPPGGLAKSALNLLLLIKKALLNNHKRWSAFLEHQEFHIVPD